MLSWIYIMIVFKPFKFIWFWEWADLEGADLRRRLFRMLNWSFFLNPFHNKNHMNWHNEAKTTRIYNYTIMSPPKGDHLQLYLCIYYPWIWYFFKLTWAKIICLYMSLFTCSSVSLEPLDKFKPDKTQCIVLDYRNPSLLK